MAENKKPANIYARDRLIKCFEDANHELNEAAGQKTSERELKAKVKLFVGDAFRKCGVDFKNPDKEGMIRAMDECRDNIKGVLGESGNKIIEKHYNEMLDIVSKIPEGKAKSNISSKP